MPITITPREYTSQLPADIMEMLDKIAQFEYKLPSDDIFKIADILERVPVFLDKSAQRIETLEVTICQLKEERKELEGNLHWAESTMKELKEKIDWSSNSDKNGRCEVYNRIQRSIGWFEKRIEEINRLLDEHKGEPDSNQISYESAVELLGLYTRNGKTHNPEIVLYVETLDSKGAKGYFAYTLIHEMFHAYFDYDQNKLSATNKYVEEPIVEYAMIKFCDDFLKSTSGCKYATDLFSFATYVSDKIRYRGTSYYGFGYYLWDYEQKSSALCDWIKDYKKVKYSSLACAALTALTEYEVPFKQGRYPFALEYHQMDLLYQILNPGKSLPTSTVPTSGVASPISSSGTPIPPTGAMSSGIIHTVLTSTTPIINKPTNINIYYTRKSLYSPEAQNAIDIITARGAKKDITRTEVFDYFNKAKISGKKDDYYTAFVAAMMWGLINTTRSNPATGRKPDAVYAFSEFQPKIVDVVKNVIMMVNSKRIAGAISYLSSGGGKIEGVGVSFFTKIMYFCDCSRSDPNSLIFDSWGQVMHIAMLIDDGDFTDLIRWYNPNKISREISSEITIDEEIYEDFIVRMEATARRYMIRSEVLEEWLFGEDRKTKFGRSSSNPRVKLLEEINKSPYKVTFK